MHTPKRARLTALSMLILAGVIATSSAASAAPATQCKLSKVAELPVTMNGFRPMIGAKINGKAALFILDSGAFYSMMSGAVASEYGLKSVPAPFGFSVEGVGGAADVRIASVREFSIAGVTVDRVSFLVGGSEVGAAGLIGQNLLERFDVEYDLANGVIRLFRSENCEATMLAYWLAEGQTASSMTIDHVDPQQPHTVGTAYVNGQKIRAAFDTGASQSVLSLTAAARAGVTADTPGVVDAGYGGGIGSGTVKQYVAPFGSFKIGDNEEIRNTKLRIADIDLWRGVLHADMLIGADFFLSHRIFVANHEHRLYLTYNGGRVFKLDPRAAEAAAVNVGMASNADELSRRGSAFAARRDFPHALEALSRAIELDPENPEYYFARANALRGAGQSAQALADYDHVLALKPDFAAAYIPRAEIKLGDNDTHGALADLDAVDGVAPKSADLRLRLAEMYAGLDHLPPAIAQYTLWIDAHPHDSRLMTAVAGRCRSNALQNQHLSEALGDCNLALDRVNRSGPGISALYTDRGLVRLRQADYPKAIADFSDALKLLPTDATALYGRAIAESRRRDRDASDADREAAKKLEPTIAEQFERYGIVE